MGRISSEGRDKAVGLIEAQLLLRQIRNLSKVMTNFDRVKSAQLKMLVILRLHL